MTAGSAAAGPSPCSLASSEAWLAFKATDRTHTLIVFPHAGGGTGAYVPLARALSLQCIDVAIVRYPGRETRLDEPPVPAMNRLVHQLAHELAPLARGDFSFFGHSMGALVAFELAHAWRGEGRSPRRLWLSGRPPPEVSSPRPLLHSLPDSAFVRALQERYGALPTSVLADRGLLALVLPALSADFSAVETYCPCEREPLAVPLSIVHGRDDPWLSGGAASGWARHTSAGMHEHAFPGGHFYLESSFEAVARCIACATSPAVP